MPEGPPDPCPICDELWEHHRELEEAECYGAWLERSSAVEWLLANSVSRRHPSHLAAGLENGDHRPAWEIREERST